MGGREVDGKDRMMGACTLSWTGANACGDAGEGDRWAQARDGVMTWTDTCANVCRDAQLQFADFTYVLGAGWW